MNLDKIEIERKKRLKNFNILFFIGLTFLVASIVLFLIEYFNKHVESIVSIIGLVIGIILILLAFGINNHGYEKFVKDNLEKIIMNDVFKNNKFTYDEKNGCSFTEMNYSGIFQNPDEFQSTDTIRSTYKDVEFVLSDYVFTRIVVTTDAKGNTTTHRYPYPGRYLSFHLERNFESGVAIIEKKNNPDVFHLNLYKNKIDFESIEFNKKFQITASDKEKAFYLIRPKEIMDFLDFQKKYKGNISNVFVNNMVYFIIADVAIDFHYSFFKKISELQIADIRAYYELPLKIIDSFSLNRDKYNAKF